MRTVIPAFVLGLALVASATRSHPRRRGSSSVRHLRSSWYAMAVDAVGTGTAGATNRVIGTGATVFRTEVPTTPGAQVGTMPIQIGAVLLGGGATRSQRAAAKPHLANAAECESV